MGHLNGFVHTSWLFRTSKGVPVEDLRGFVREWLRSHPGGKIYVGTDSKTRGSEVKYSTVVCLWDVGSGVWEAYANQVIEKPKDRFTRLWNEIMRSVEIAEYLKDIAPITVHMDFNSNPRFPSYRLYDAGMGLIQSLGFDGAGKPHSWAATSGANRHCQ
ncbi:MAG: hypothetical protein LPK80_05750 [Bacteroidota bacterium]|nr:hypothetical protein [Bacteroidota bacterium]MDX5404278.1 hypothetical protein [Bacteroidota bacterium]MDX5427437.1 hypothetical protein [Bacteroidota bacterium]MDX5447023.1 hypothetical protein [Bacteroidota bacterium]MDX5505382.1 hypothetical protein [Bacteroidota bacterium]